MQKHFDYTTQARSFALRFPLLTYISIQINYWVVGYLLMVTVMYLTGQSIIKAHDLNFQYLYMPIFWSALIIGIIYGATLGFIDWVLEKTGRRLSLGLLILIRSFIYIFVLLAIFAILRYILWEWVIVEYLYDETNFVSNEASWKYIFYLFGIYSIVLSPGISFINQMNRKFGPGALVPMLLGRYRKPREQERLFMFLDMQSSTSHAEKLGHLTYSSLIQDCFLEINDVLTDYNAEIYQYVGDEIVVNWLKTKHLKGKICLDFFFACQKQFDKQKVYFENKYGLIPRFKAGVHVGTVVTAEVGNIKREIAYHGDTLNTAARIQSLCNQYNKSLLISGEVAEFVGTQSGYSINSLGELALRGKGSVTHLFSVDI